ncbi:hypothetical protein QBZ16_004452 [Prototheca wickerhamii]|uniref:Uncharacterized protein n=1 Tax=Prototheca wickerhamii TaxID=3111 RepID=A0AAD9IKD5_PROWI|nr:hypothetical protein QBZ16_004452 [Prototheca wickerhamii]
MGEAHPPLSFRIMRLNPPQLPLDASSTFDVELHTERGPVILVDPRGAAALTLAAGAYHSVQIAHDIKEVGPHSLICSAVGLGEHNSRVAHSQSFRFPVTNPITVRSKQRVVEDTVLLEVVLESAVSHPFFLTRHVFLPHSPFVMEEVAPAPSSSAPESAGPLRASQAQHPLLAPKGGQYGLVYRLQAQQSEAGPRSPTAAAQDPNAMVPLGRLDLEWTGPMGEVSRLQTQSISMSRSLLPRKRGDVSLRLAALEPSCLAHETPFFVRLEVSNAGRRPTGPLLAAWQGVATRGAIVASGPHTAGVGPLAPGERATATLRMLPLMAGQQAITGLMLTDERTGTVLDRLPPQEVFVNPG